MDSHCLCCFLHYDSFLLNCPSIQKLCSCAFFSYSETTRSLVQRPGCKKRKKNYARTHLFPSKAPGTCHDSHLWIKDILLLDDQLDLCESYCHDRHISSSVSGFKIRASFVGDRRSDDLDHHRFLLDIPYGQRRDELRAWLCYNWRDSYLHNHLCLLHRQKYNA